MASYDHFLGEPADRLYCHGADCLRIKRDQQKGGVPAVLSVSFAQRLSASTICQPSPVASRLNIHSNSIFFSSMIAMSFASFELTRLDW